MVYRRDITDYILYGGNCTLFLSYTVQYIVVRAKTIFICGAVYVNDIEKSTGGECLE